MKHEVLTRPGVPVRLWRKWRRRGPMLQRHRRYLITAGSWVLAIWILTALYLALAPHQYRSKFTLILPGSGAGSTLNVESIGQAQSAAASAFASAKLSPTENYKRLLMTDITLRESAGKVGDPDAYFPSPRIKLVDQTNLIEVELTGGTSEEAHQRAAALQSSFLQQLDKLRADEAIKREQSESKNLISLEKKVRAAQQALLDFQAKTGLVSLDQFNARIAGMDALRDRERTARIALRQKTSQSGALSALVGKSPQTASRVLRLSSDPLFQQLAANQAKAEAAAQEKAATLGENHGTLAQARAESENLRTAMLRRGKEISGLSAQKILAQSDISIAAGRSNLMQDSLTAHAEAAGLRTGLAEIQRDMRNQGAQSKELVKQASKLADLMRGHRVAEAVFSSALARIDTNKQDPFASYPLVQVLEAPSLPDTPSSPSIIIALATATGTTILIIIGLGLLWFREPILRKITPKL